MSNFSIKEEKRRQEKEIFEIVHPRYKDVMERIILGYDINNPLSDIFKKYKNEENVFSNLQNEFEFALIKRKEILTSICKYLNLS